MDTCIASKAIPWAQPSNRTRQDRCGRRRASYYKHLVWSLTIHNSQTGWAEVADTHKHTLIDRSASWNTNCHPQTCSQVAAASHGQACTRHRRAGIRLRHQQAGAWAWPSFFFISKPMQTHRRGQFGWPAVMAGRSKPEAPYLPGLSHNKQTDRSTGRQDHPSHEQ